MKHTHTYTHNVLRNVELINTPTHKDLVFILLIVLWTKTPSQSLTMKTQIHTLTIKSAGLLEAVLDSDK